MGKNLSSYVRGGYCQQFERENDKYAGLFSKKQLDDLEGGASLKVGKISKKESDRLLRQQKTTGLNMSDPFGFGI